MGSGLNEFETDFGFSVGIDIAKRDAAGLLLCGFGFLTTMTGSRVTGRFK